MLELPTYSQFSISKGVYFVYKDNDNTIVCWGSTFSGKEKVFLNSKLVVENQTNEHTSKHILEDQKDNKYKVSYLTSFKHSLIQCQIHKNGDLVKTFMCRPKSKKLFDVKKFAMFALVVVALTVIANTYTVSPTSHIIAVIIALIIYTRSIYHGRMTIIES